MSQPVLYSNDFNERYITTAQICFVRNLQMLLFKNVKPSLNHEIVNRAILATFQLFIPCHVKNSDI